MRFLIIDTLRTAEQEAKPEGVFVAGCVIAFGREWSQPLDGSFTGFAQILPEDVAGSFWFVYAWEMMMMMMTMTSIIVQLSSKGGLFLVRSCGVRAKLVCMFQVGEYLELGGRHARMAAFHGIEVVGMSGISLGSRQAARHERRSRRDACGDDVTQLCCL